MEETDTILETKAENKTSDGSHDLFSHYAEKAEILEAMVNGVPIVALCGKIWIPSRDPSKFPLCPVCKELHNALFLSD